jgi:hypothetical protein
MRVSLLNIWKGSMLEEQRSLLPLVQRNFSDKVMQSSFEFSNNLKMVFVTDKMTMAPIKHYHKLPEVTLTREEQEIAYNISQDILRRPNGYDGMHILVSDVIYDDVENILYIEAKRTTFSVLCGLNGKFPKDSPIMQQDLYGMGVLVPLLTNDGHTILLQSSKFDKKNYTTVAGFVQPETRNSSLSHIVEKAANQELMEELLADSQLAPRIEVQNRLEVSCLSFRKPEGARGFIEFYLPAILKADCQRLIKVVQTNQAPDRYEHTGVVQAFNLEPRNRFYNYDQWSAQNPGGKDQYPIVVSQASRMYNRDYYGDNTQHVMPESRQKTYPVNFFKPQILIAPSEKQEYKYEATI